MNKWMTSYQKSNETYIIQSEKTYDYQIPEEIRYVTILSHSGFIIKKNKTIFISIQPFKCNTTTQSLEN